MIKKELKTGVEIDLGHSRLVLRPDGILVMYCDEDTIYEVEQIKEVVEATGKLTGGKKCAQLTIAGKYSSVTRETRDFIATDEAVKYTSAEAYVIQSLAQRILGNFYLKFYTPKVPTRVFTDVEKAEEWLKKMVQE
jgi:hypothetical protein